MKLTFFDIDGTLINEKQEMPPSTPLAIKKAQENGHLCLVNTGRTASLVLNWLPKLVNFDGYLCGCGTQILFQGKELLHKTLTLEESSEIIRDLEAFEIDAILEGVGNDFHNDLDKMHTKAFRQYIYDRYRKHNWLSYREAPGNYDKFFCYADDPAQVMRFMERHADLLDLIDREHGYFEIVPKGYSKATAMDRLIEYLNGMGKYAGKITLADTVCIGDSNNDLPMLEHAGCAIAMGNSSRQVLEMADFVTTAVCDDGIWNALEWINNNPGI